jgi:hypothetical protein
MLQDVLRDIQQPVPAAPSSQLPLIFTAKALPPPSPPVQPPTSYSYDPRDFFSEEVEAYLVQKYYAGEGRVPEASQPRQQTGQGDEETGQGEQSQEEKEQVEVREVVRFGCPVCGRKFGQEALSKHEPVCKQVFFSKRKAYDSKARRQAK